ncbi:MAG TPA: sigma-E factor negative regulatory protein [Marinagarivorans sp.]
MTSTHTKSPSEQTLESLSALVDGEASEFEGRRLLDMVSNPTTSNSVLREKWQRYHLCGTLIRKELAMPEFSDLSGRISAAIFDEADHATEQPATAVAKASASVEPSATAKLATWKDWMAKSAIAASVAFAVVVGVQYTQTGMVGVPTDGQIAAQDPVVSAPVGFDVPAPVARNVSLGSLNEPQRKIQAAVPAKQQFLSNAAVEAELQQLFLDHAELSAENGKFGLMPMARAAKMVPAE